MKLYIERDFHISKASQNFVLNWFFSLSLFLFVAHCNSFILQHLKKVRWRDEEGIKNFPAFYFAFFLNCQFKLCKYIHFFVFSSFWGSWGNICLSQRRDACWGHYGIFISFYRAWNCGRICCWFVQIILIDIYFIFLLI